MTDATKERQRAELHKTIRSIADIARIIARENELRDGIDAIVADLEGGA